jgi:hypothetical protein
MYKKCTTNKIFYSKYVYKLVVYNKLASIFRSELQRGKELSYAREKLDEYNNYYSNNQPITKTIFRTTTIVSNDDFLDARDIYKCLKILSEDYLVRVGIGNELIIYCNDKSELISIANKMRTERIEFHEPSNKIAAYLKNNTDVVIVKNKPQFNLRVTLGRKNGSKDLANWLKNNKDKSKVGRKTLENLETESYVDGLYFYLRDEKLLQLITLICVDNIRRVQKLVWYSELDKY